MVGFWYGSGISWTICKESAVCTSLQTDNHTNTISLNLYRPDALPDAQTTVSKQGKSTANNIARKGNVSLKMNVINASCCASHIRED